jgi:hypothetical protein
VQRFAWFAGWWVVLFWLWLAFAGEWNRIEWVAAAIAATVTTVIAEVVRRQRLLRFRFSRRWLRELVGVPLQILVDCGVVLAALPRRPRGVFRERDSGPKGRSAEAAGRAAFLTLASGFSPNAYVVDVDRDSGSVRLHDLVERSGSERPA